MGPVFARRSRERYSSHPILINSRFSTDNNNELLSENRDCEFAAGICRPGREREVGLSTSTRSTRPVSLSASRFSLGSFSRVLLQDVCGGVSFNGLCYTCTDPSAQIDTPALESGGGCTCSTGVCLQAPDDDLSNTTPAPADPSGGDDTDNDEATDDFTDDDASDFSDDEATDDDFTDDDASDFSADEATDNDDSDDD